MSIERLFKRFFKSPEVGSSSVMLSDEQLCHLTKAIQAQYDNEASRFQEKYNKKHKNSHIWRHGFKRETKVFYINQFSYEISVELVCFTHAKKGGSFMFYGTMFMRNSKFSKQFILCALTKGTDNRIARGTTTSKTVANWRRSYRRWEEKYASFFSAFWWKCQSQNTDGFEPALLFWEWDGRFPMECL